jgi:hypothetical protein
MVIKEVLLTGLPDNVEKRLEKEIQIKIMK